MLTTNLEVIISRIICQVCISNCRSEEWFNDIHGQISQCSASVKYKLSGLFERRIKRSLSVHSSTHSLSIHLPVAVVGSTASRNASGFSEWKVGERSLILCLVNTTKDNLAQRVHRLGFVEEDREYVLVNLFLSLQIEEEWIVAGGRRCDQWVSQPENAIHAAICAVAGGIICAADGRRVRVSRKRLHVGQDVLRLVGQAKLLLFNDSASNVDSIHAKPARSASNAIRDIEHLIHVFECARLALIEFSQWTHGARAAGSRYPQIGTTINRVNMYYVHACTNKQTNLPVSRTSSKF